MPHFFCPLLVKFFVGIDSSSLFFTFLFSSFLFLPCDFGALEPWSLDPTSWDPRSVLGRFLFSPRQLFAHFFDFSVCGGRLGDCSWKPHPKNVNKKFMQLRFFETRQRLQVVIPKDAECRRGVCGANLVLKNYCLSEVQGFTPQHRCAKPWSWAWLCA